MFAATLVLPGNCRHNDTAKAQAKNDRACNTAPYHAFPGPFISSELKHLFPLFNLAAQPLSKKEEKIINPGKESVYQGGA